MKPQHVYEQELRDKADSLFESMKIVQISPAFDAPQFAQDWAVVCARTMKCRALEIRARMPKTNKQGQVISWSSAGKMGFKGSKKNTPYAAQMAASDAAKVAFEAGMKRVDVYVKGPGAGRESAIRALSNSGIEVVMIKDVTPLPHNGCRPPKKRRV